MRKILTTTSIVDQSRPRIPWLANITYKKVKGHFNARAVSNLKELDMKSHWAKHENAHCYSRTVSETNKVRLIDASFIWTEPHSKRIKIKLKIQKEIQEGAVLEQTVPVSHFGTMNKGPVLWYNVQIEFVVQGAQCTDCQRVEAKDYWKSVVQGRVYIDKKIYLFNNSNSLLELSI